MKLAFLKVLLVLKGLLIVELRRRTIFKHDDILYRLPQETIFNGINDCIDTGIKLYDITNGTFTIYFRADTSDGSNSSLDPVFYCVYEASPWPGICFQSMNGSSYYYAGCPDTSGGYTSDSISSSDNYQGCVVCENGIITKIKSKIGNQTINNLSIFSHSAHDSARLATLLLGCYETIDGTKGRFWKGTIFDFIVYNKVLNDEEINNLFK